MPPTKFSLSTNRA